MKKILTLIIFCSLLSISFANQDQKVCTKEYIPVCGSIQVLCVRAPCPPIQQTFGNKCEMEAAGAKFLYSGECGKGDIDITQCESYFDGCNNCSVTDGKLIACTMMYCENPQKPKCLKYKDSKPIGLANPASVYCEKNGGKLQIKTDANGGQYGICAFLNGSSCEERAYFRGECEPSGSTARYISGYLSQNSEKFPNIESKITFLKNLKNKFTQRYKNISQEISDIIKGLYADNYENKKFTLRVDGQLIAFSLHIPASWGNKYTEHISLDSQSSTLVFKYKSRKSFPSMIFSITATSQKEWESLVAQGAPNSTKIINSDSYVLYYSQALDMPYTGKDSDIYGKMTSQTYDIINSFKLIQQ